MRGAPLPLPSPRVPGGAGHVAIVVRKGMLVEAPRTGLPVRVRVYDGSDPGLRLGRLPASALLLRSLSPARPIASAIR
jgi:cell wall-associated NlpC family hydrolase